MEHAKKMHRFILDILFPITCLSCAAEEAWLCEKCAARLQLQDEQVCPVCEKAVTPSGRTCFGCRKKSSLDALLAVFSYNHDLVRRMVHYYKYRFIPDLHTPLGHFLTASLLKSDLPVPDVIIPVPLHPRRLRWRGFNQSQLLAECIGENITPGFVVPIQANTLSRKRYTLPQMSIQDALHRQQNITDAFAISSATNVAGKNILLVDDIATTGATLFECARILKAAGAQQVWAIVIARQEIKRLIICKNCNPATYYSHTYIISTIWPMISK